MDPGWGWTSLAITTQYDSERLTIGHPYTLVRDGTRVEMSSQARGKLRAQALWLEQTVQRQVVHA
jgi:hypothetical protein